MKNKCPVQVKLNFNSGRSAVLDMPDYKSVKTALCTAEATVYANWFNSDINYNPSRGFVISKLLLNDNLQLIYLEVTENWEGGFNE